MLKSSELFSAPFELPKIIGKTAESSVPVLSAAKPRFPQGFSHFWPVALEFCSAHATRCMAPAALYYPSVHDRRLHRRYIRRQNIGEASPFPGTLPTPPIHSPLHHHLRHASRLGKILLGDQQVTLLCDPWRVAKPRTNHLKWELALQFLLPAGPPLLKLYGVEQSWPTRDAREAQESRHFGA